MLDACKHVCAYVCMFSAWKQTTLLPEGGGFVFWTPHPQSSYLYPQLSRALDGK